MPAARRSRRERLDAWLDEQARAGKGTKAPPKELRERFFRQAVEEAAHTLLNRLVFLRILEHHDVLRPHVVTGGFRSPGYAGEFLQYAGPLAQDDSKGYALLLQAVFDELALELPGLFGPVGLTALFPVPAAMLREVVEALNEPALDSAWGDDTTLGWVYQYWNDPVREALDAKISGGGKIEPWEIASKTQMFTERYMVEWLLQNSLGLTWLALCKKNGWTPDAATVLPELDARRAAWRQKRELGEVTLDALMPIEAGLESTWKYYVPQQLPDDAVAKAPASIADVKLLDPACGSGHFLVIAFGLFAVMYEEEARHRGEAWTHTYIIDLVKEGKYDVVVGNPPYQGLTKTAGFEYVTRNYPRGRADLYAAFLERGLELVRDSGISALLTMRGWMFLGKGELRKQLMHNSALLALLDLDSGAFEDVSAAQVVLSVACSVFRKAAPSTLAIALRPTPIEDRASTGMIGRKRAALLAQVGRHEFDPRGFAVIDAEPIVYWWTTEFLDRYARAPKLKDRFATRVGLQTGENARFLRMPWEVSTGTHGSPGNLSVDAPWAPYIKGAAGQEWLEPLNDLVRWRLRGAEIHHFSVNGRLASRPQNASWYFQKGIAFSMIGASFSARAHRFPSIFGHKGSSVFPQSEVSRSEVLCMMNSTLARLVLQSLNPGIGFEIGDVNRLPIFAVENADKIFSVLENDFTGHEGHREPSVEFRLPGPSSWRATQDWAQRAVDRTYGTPLPHHAPELDPPNPEAYVSFSIGVALGRFGANGEGLLDTAPNTELPAGILFVGASDAYPDSLSHPSLTPLLTAWDAYLPPEGRKPALRDWLRKDFFAYHKGLYENRPIYFPLSSEKKTFVAWVSIHRWTDATLTTLLADHLRPALRRLAGEIADVNAARASSDKKTALGAEKQYEKARRLHDELDDFVKAVTACAERGAPPTDPGCPSREVHATFKMDLDDGVMINSAALWPLLAPQWNDPKKWWKQLCLADGKKDYDWARLARRYFPTRVDAKCREDPSLAVAHGCFWRYHPAKAFAWELRLQDEIRDGFTIDEPGSDAARTGYLRAFAGEAEAVQEKERVRRERKAAKRGG